MELHTGPEIRNILRGLRMTMLLAEKAAPSEAGSYLQGYNDGFAAALVSLSLALGYTVGPWRADGPTWIEGLTNE